MSFHSRKEQAMTRMLYCRVAVEKHTGANANMQEGLVQLKMQHRKIHSRRTV